MRRVQTRFELSRKNVARPKKMLSAKAYQFKLKLLNDNLVIENISKNCFILTIHNNVHIYATDKFYYVISLLQGKAKSTVDCLPKREDM